MRAQTASSAPTYGIAATNDAVGVAMGDTAATPSASNTWQSGVVRGEHVAVGEAGRSGAACGGGPKSVSHQIVARSPVFL